ncbi:cbb3-type cytochrome c oxidase subunit I [Pelagicoccus sp. NFK12]|uniref:Cbb3-type cytochrome c oxidase subunit I n=1 Tax=Pelagicoccus enzymogenes TaxID=2773457 RepID=A0A927F7A7_9BACT|nr:cbb3-type cytochrome c oxidase subunit I [Pelagicoccus enzymogenes]MBD5779768.1 cbb3-type cytochrome c oxidase subunit I [Pelagicoccus enzymogenes]MDQ8200286.1 cbb3-type cytochrome c oxidase subunit I [Pelagicoccus enzymogenes]
MATNSTSETRTCDTTGLPVCLTAQLFIKLSAVCAVVFLLLGGVAAILLALTRWQTIHLLPVDWFYRILTFHGLNMLIFWILFFEVAVLYFACTVPLKAKLFSRKVAWVGFIMMLVGAVMVDYIILKGKADVLMTSYLPLLAHPAFYLGIILVAVGTLIGVFNFFATLYVAKRDRTYEGSVPLVTFGATAAAIIAVVTLLHGAIVMIPTFTFAMGWTPEPDPMWYRTIWWGLGHQSQQVNVCAMVAIWYLVGYLATGAKPINETVCRGAFVLYILFINLASAHHLLVDPAVGATWKIWNTSYAMYLAVLASMIHGFTVPASVEMAMRYKGYTKGLFGWVTKLPWRNPAFSAAVLSVVIFGFIGGITGVTLGTQQINIIAHNTLRITGHFHATVVGGTSLAFMGLTYYVIPLIFQRDFIGKGWARIQPWLFGGGILMVSLGMSFAGSLGVPRRDYDIEPAGVYGASSHLFLGIMGVGAIIAVLALLIFVLLCVGTLLFGKKNAGRPIYDWGTAVALPGADESKVDAHWGMKGTIALTAVFLMCFAVYYFANWKALADVWPVQ